VLHLEKLALLLIQDLEMLIFQNLQSYSQLWESLWNPQLSNN